MQKCAVCLKQTDKCCSLCRKLFYCSPEHQEVHWHMVHKFSCEGKIQTTQANQEDFRIYAQSIAKSNYQTIRNNQQDAKIFIEFFQERLSMRKNVLTKYLSVRQAISTQLLGKELVKQAIQLVEISRKVTQSYKSTISDILEQSYGLVTNNFIIKVDQLLDKVLLARCYQLCSMIRQLKEVLMSIGNETQSYPDYVDQEFVPIYKKLLISIIDVSQLANFDKIAEKMYSSYIKMIERFDGIWEQIYAYYNMGIWYAHKTYYQKALKCFTYSLELIASHKSSREVSDNSIIFKGDAMFNVSLCRHSINQREKAFENMQQSYRLRVQGLGKSSMEASDSLFILSKWCLQEKQYENCLQYVMQCLRIRKANPTFIKELQDIHNLIIEMYELIRKQKQQNQRSGSPQNIKYFDKLLEDEESFRETEIEKRESFTKRLLDNEKDMVTFRFDISPEFYQTLTPLQCSKMEELIDLIDKKIEKEEARRILFESDFAMSLDEQQRITFIKINKIP